jgi:hypothetical protein
MIRRIALALCPLALGCIVAATSASAQSSGIGQPGFSDSYGSSGIGQPGFSNSYGSSGIGQPGFSGSYGGGSGINPY